MLIAHVIPGYFATHLSKPYWDPTWSQWRCRGLWAVAIGSTIAPDLDVIYNTIWRGFANHSTLWTHSLFPYLIILLIWLVLQRMKRWPYVQMLVWLIAMGGLSHLLLDVIAHSTPLFYPLSMIMVGIPPARVVEGGFWAYLSDPIFLFEPFLLTLAATHWFFHYVNNQRIRLVSVSLLIVVLGVFTASFLLLLPLLQKAVSGLT